MAVARWAVDRHSTIHQPLATFINIIDGIGEVAEIAPLAIAFFIPIIGKFDLRGFIAGGRKEDKREPPGLAIKALKFLKAKQAKESDGCVWIRHADHGVEIFHRTIIASLGTRRNLIQRNHPSPLNRRECLFKIGDQIIGIFNPN